MIFSAGWSKRKKSADQRLKAPAEIDLDGKKLAIFAMLLPVKLEYSDYNYYENEPM